MMYIYNKSSIKGLVDVECFFVMDTSEAMSV